MKRIGKFLAELGWHIATMLLLTIFFVYGLFTKNQWRLFFGNLSNLKGR